MPSISFNKSKRDPWENYYFPYFVNEIAHFELAYFILLKHFTEARVKRTTALSLPLPSI